jgi:hypothetical protein
MSSEKKQMTISHVFTAKAETKTKAEAKAEAKKGKKEDSPVSIAKKLASSDKRVQAFYDQLCPNEVIAHTIAVDRLGTSYDVTRTHGFLRWAKANPTL